MANSVNRIGVLTGGGDCPGLNAVIRAVVKTAVNLYGWEVMGIENGFEGLVQPDMVHALTLADVRGLLPRGGTILGTTNRANPFRYEVEIAGEPEVFDVSNDVIRRVQVLGLDALVVIGGDGSLAITHELIQKGLRAVAVPKTIDNDLMGTETTFGFDTAVNTAMEALDKLHTTAESHHRVIVLELMGRDAGWIALCAGIAGGADVILIPEIPFRLEAAAAHIEERRRRGARFSIVVVAEGARSQDGKAVYCDQRELGAAPRLGGIGEALAAQLRACLRAEVRVTVLGHLQRGGSPSAYDRLLASRFGTMAVHLIAHGQLGHMVALENDRVVSVPITDVAGKQKFVPLEGDIVQTAIGLDICLGLTPAELAERIAATKTAPAA